MISSVARQGLNDFGSGPDNFGDVKTLATAMITTYEYKRSFIYALLFLSCFQS